ncbi:MAG: MFS transporter [Pseudobutyrivibrio sp.]|nr:MFS transporter [Pseudobutyrivibrio sp.]
MVEKFKNSLEFRLNLKYFFAQGLYWMIVCCTTSMGSAFLSGRGYSTAAIGALFAVSYLMAALLQQVITSFADKSRDFTVLDITGILSIILFFNMLFAVGSHGKSFACGLTFFIAVALSAIIQPLLNSLNFYLEGYKISMNYGLARANGSFLFFVISIIVGNLMNAISVNAAPVLAAIITLAFIFDLFWIYFDIKTEKRSNETTYDPFEGNANDGNYSLKTAQEFIGKYKAFFIFLIGMTGFYFSHMIINNFMFQIAVNVGGDTADNGGLIALAALVELPGMIFFNKLSERFGDKVLMIFSAGFFVVKVFFTLLASSIGMLYFSMLFQGLSFAIFIPASIHFVNQIMSERDAVKGQGFLTISMTISNFAASLLGGAIMNLFGVKSALAIGLIIALAGFVTSFYGLVRINTKK